MASADHVRSGLRSGLPDPFAEALSTGRMTWGQPEQGGDATVVDLSVTTLSKAEPSSSHAAAVVILRSRRDGPPCHHAFSGCLIDDGPAPAAARAARDAIRLAVANAELRRREIAAAATGLPIPPVAPLRPASALYLGAATPAFLALRTNLQAKGVRLFAPGTVMMALDCLSEGQADATIIDSSAGDSRALSILAAIKRNARTARTTAVIVAPRSTAEFDIAAARRGAHSVWLRTEAGSRLFADWLAYDIAIAREARSVDDELEAMAEAADESPDNALAYRAALLRETIKDHAHTARPLCVVAIHNGKMSAQRRDQQVALARQIVRRSDSVFAYEDAMIVVAPYTTATVADAIAARITSVLSQYGARDVTARVVQAAPTDTIDSLRARFVQAAARRIV